jgi:hypothetical protein
MAAVRGDIDAAPNPGQMPRKRNVYPPEVNTPEAHIEFLRSIANIINERADEVELDVAKRRPE